MTFDPATGNQVELIEVRPDGNGLYRDTVTEARIICKREAMTLYPRGEAHAA